MGVPFDQSALLQQDEHGPDGARIGRHAAGQLPLGESVPAPNEPREQDELVGTQFKSHGAGPENAMRDCGSAISIQTVLRTESNPGRAEWRKSA